MCNFPNIQYEDNFPPLNDLPVLPRSPQGMYSILINNGIVNPTYLLDMNVHNMIELEDEIFARIQNYSGSDEELRDIFCLIHIWGGISGRGIFIRGNGFVWDEIKVPYRALVCKCISTPILNGNVNPLDVAENCIAPIYKSVCDFYRDSRIHHISTSFITKHTRYWLQRNNPNNPLPIYDSTFATNLMSYAGVYMRSLPVFWNCMIDKARLEHISLLSLERQLFNHWN